jgi:excisionase family DNA binding protein
MTQVLTAEQLAESLSLNAETIRRLTRSGELPHHVIGGSIRYTLADVLAKTAVNKHPDDAAVDQFAALMHEKMTAARLKGKEGWEDPERCTDADLGKLMCEAVLKADWVDVANYAMMLHLRGGK